jgi:hypothetical protein
MRWSMPPAISAALTFALAAAAPIASWWLTLFYVTPPNQPALDWALEMLGHTLSSENADLWWFIGWAALPICLLALSTLYLTPLVRHRSWAIGLFCAAVIVTLYSLFAVPPLGAVLTLALYLSYRCIHGA